MAWLWEEASVYCPTPAQFPAEVHETPTRIAAGSVPASVGAVTLVAWAQVPLVSVADMAWLWEEASWYSPTAAQLPAEVHVTPKRNA
jgi:hypothetical protein